MSPAQGDSLWSPDQSRIDSGELSRFRRWLRDEGRATFGDDDYRSLWQWSIDDVGGFWSAFAEFCDVELANTTCPATTATMPAQGWFPDTELNYTAEMFRHDRDGDAVVAVADDGAVTTTSWHELRRQVAALGAHLRSSGVLPGDRVVAVLPVGIEAIVGQLAAAAVGAVWSIVAPEFGEEAIVSRLGQLDPSVLIASGGYPYGGKYFDRTTVITRLLEELVTLTDVIWVGEVDAAITDHQTSARASRWADVVSTDHELRTKPVGFEHPLWVLFSSGTTGVPKGIVHGHGGIVLEHNKVLRLHADVTDDSVVLIVGSTSWVVWTMQVSALLTGATIVLLEGNAAAPDLDRIWHVAAEQHVTVLGVGAAYVHACLHADLTPATTYDLSALRMLQVTGSPLSVEGYEWVYRSVAPDVWLASMSGGTDVASIFVGGIPGAPVRAGRIQGAALGVAAGARDEDGHAVVGSRGELVVTVPMPSMPLRFWGDIDGTRYRSSYFEQWPGVWKQGDFVEFDTDGSCVILGRSDSTLNRNGIRMGSADIYRAVEIVASVREALVVGVEEGDRYYMPLYVALTEGSDPEVTIAEIKRSIRSSLSPRHLPDEIIVVRDIPHTRTGKKLEVPVKRLLMGADLSAVVDLGAVDDPDVMREFAELASEHRTPGTSSPDHIHAERPSVAAQ